MENLDFSRFADKFIDDAHNLLNELEGKLLELEQDKNNHELIESVFRSMHTLKGIGAMFGFVVISDYTHHLETIYDKVREGLIKIDKEIFEITFVSVDHLRNLLADQELKDKKLAAHHTELVNKLINIVSTEEITGTAIANEADKPALHKEETWYIQFICSEDLIRRAINIEYVFQDMAKIGTYTIFSHSTEMNEQLGMAEEMWGILFTTQARFVEIEEVFMFVMDYVRIIRLSDYVVPEAESNAAVPQAKSIMELATALGNRTEETIAASELKIENTPVERKILKTPRISVGADKLDKLMNLVSELFTTRSELQTATSDADMVRIKLAVEKIDKLSSQFRNNALSIRLVPLRELTLKFKRLVRDLSNQLGKDIDFEVQGDDTELDKNLVDSLGDPFMHLIRNCVDHGIELPGERIKNGKEGNGKIKFSAYQTGNYIYIQICDDGKGISIENIRSKAVEKGFIQPKAQLSDKEILDLIFLPGFSTAQSLTQVSGRGVGMDVVKRAITDLRGTVEVETEEGKGTTFTIKLQQTISIMDTLLVKAADSYFTLILEEVEICGLEESANLYARQNSQLVFADDLIPFISLRKALYLGTGNQHTERIIIVKRQNVRFAIVVDKIIGQYQAVIKPLGTTLKHKEYLSGASIMGNGKIAFMLDTQKLYNHIN